MLLYNNVTRARSMRATIYTGAQNMNWISEGNEAYTGIWWGNLRKRDQLWDAGVDGRIILRWIFR